MKTVALFISLILLASSSLAGERLSQTYDIDGVREVRANHAARLEIRQGDQESLRAEGTAEALSHLQVNLSQGVLTLENKKPAEGIWGWLGLSNNHSQEVTFYIQVRQLDRLQLSGASHANLQSLRGNQFDLHLNGASRANVGSIIVEEIDLYLSGASHADLQQLQVSLFEGRISGASRLAVNDQSQSQTIDINLSGASKFLGQRLHAKTGKVDVSGASYAEVRVNDALKARASGASNIDYYGQPRLQQHSSGASNIRHKGD